MLFLRFFNPAICTPETLGLFKGEVSPGQRRALVQISKVIQCATNGSLFETDDTMSGMLSAHHVFNEWLRKQDGSMRDLFGGFVTMTEEDEDVGDLVTPRSGEASNHASPRPPHSAPLAGSSSLPTVAVASSPSSPGRAFFGNLLSSMQSSLARSRVQAENLGLRLSSDASLALRLQVLDTLVVHQKRVENLVSHDNKLVMQWLWLKESLKSSLDSAVL